MATFNLYSKQQKATRVKRVLQHTKLPHVLRVQIKNVLLNVSGRGELSHANSAAWEIFSNAGKILCQEYGVPELSISKQGFTHIFPRTEVLEFFMNETDVGKCLDVIQVTLHLAADAVKRFCEFHEATMTIEDGIAEINERFKEHGVGFQVVDGQIIKLTSEYIFQEITTPALKLLREEYLAGANQEFLTAHEHFRNARYKECLNECLKAFESTMKAICHNRGWAHGANATASPLIRVCLDNHLVPVFMESHLTALRTILESGVPTARNKTSGHGQGITPIIVFEEFASYVLAVTAANIVLLVNSQKRLK